MSHEIRTPMPAVTEPAAPANAAAGSIPSALAKEATELAVVSVLAVICSELSAKSEVFAPYAAKVARLADDFDFDGILKLVDEFEQ